MTRNVPEKSEGQGELDLGVPTPSARKEPVGRRQARRSLHAMVEIALERGYASSLGDLLDQAAAIRQYRLYNSLLAVLQRPHSEHLLTAEEWELKWRRVVRPTEHPIVLLWPFGPLMFLFDVSQTEPLPGARDLPKALSNPYSMDYVQDADYALGWLTMNAKHDGVRTSGARRGYSSAGCIQRSESQGWLNVEARDGSVQSRSVPLRFEVLLNEAHSETERLATLAHELGHLYCGHLGASRGDWWPSRRPDAERAREFEAENVARLVFRRIAPEATLPDHLRQYFPDGEPLPSDGWDHVVAAADRIVDMCQGISPRRKK